MAGDSFGEFAFVTGLARTISVTSEGFTQAFKIKREDFLLYLSHFQIDKERFFMMRDNLILYQNERLFKCMICGTQGHLCKTCPSLHNIFNKEQIIQRYNFPHIQPRSNDSILRRARSKNPKNYINIFTEAAKQLQSKISNELPTSSYVGPSSSQLPYDFNDSHGGCIMILHNSERVFYKFKGLFQHETRNRTKQFLPNLGFILVMKMFNQRDVESQDIPHRSDNYIEDEDDVIQNYFSRRPQIKHTVKTAGFPQTRLLYKGFGMHESGGKKKMGLQTDGLAVANIQQGSSMSQNLVQQYYVITQNIRNQHISNQPVASIKMGRSSTPRLTFMYHNQNSVASKDESQRQDSYQGQHSLRQNSNRSLTYSNNRTLQKNLKTSSSYNTRKKTISPQTSVQNNQLPHQPSGTAYSMSHSHSGHSPQQNLDRRIDSDQNITEKHSLMRKSTRKKSTRTNTRVSIMNNQMSGFTPFILPDNPIYVNTDYGMAKFEKMKSFKLFFPHNNYDQVLIRLNKFMAQDKKIQQNYRSSPYTTNSFTARKIKLVQKILYQLIQHTQKKRESDQLILSIRKCSINAKLIED